MVKVSSRDAINILRLFEVADDNNVPRNIEMLKISHPSPINTLTSFKFNKHQLHILFDDAAEDDIDFVLTQVKKVTSDVQLELFKNPKDTNNTYAMPYHGKACYLLSEISNKKRLDSELAKRYPQKSRSTWQKHIKSGHVSVNGTVVLSAKFDTTNADSIAINVPPDNDYKNNQLPILYIDDNVIVINKPSGVLSHSKGALNDEFTVADFFKQYSTFNTDTNRPGIVHRLDRETSGVMIGARNAEAAALLQKQFSERKAKKTYYAVLNGIPKLDKANIDLPIARNPSLPSKFKVDPKGKTALTRYDVIDTNGKYSLVKLQPQTGRTHQLRVHMLYINSPILGDRVYDKPAKRLFLHAESLEITIPNGIRRTFTAPIPNDFLDMLKL